MKINKTGILLTLALFGRIISIFLASEFVKSVIDLFYFYILYSVNLQVLLILPSKCIYHLYILSILGRPQRFRSSLNYGTKLLIGLSSIPF